MVGTSSKKTEPIRYTFTELSQTLGKARVYVHHLQKTLDLHVPAKSEGYSEAYLAFMEGIVALRTFSISLDDICDLFRKEMKILRLLHVDSISDSPTWYLDMCSYQRECTGRLLLTGHDLGFSTQAKAIQANLDFHEHPPELFDGAEMGEDVRVVLCQYIELVAKIRDQVAEQTGVVKNALAWAQRYL